VWDVKPQLSQSVVVLDSDAATVVEGSSLTLVDGWLVVEVA